MNVMAFVGLVALFSFANVASANPPSPYAGEERREIKSLSPQEIGDYLAGKGMGLAKAAELNGYPGPAHVLLPRRSSSAERKPARRIYSSACRKTPLVGPPLIDGGNGQAVCLRTVTPETLNASLSASARFKRSSAISGGAPTQTQILTPAQTAKYVELRGYGGDRLDTGQHHKH